LANGPVPAGGTPVGDGEDPLSRFDRDLKLLAAGVLFYALGAGMYLQLLPVYELQLGAPKIWVGILTAIMLAMAAAGNIPGAWAAHRFPLRWVIVSIWWVMVPAAVSFALAPSWPWLIVGLALSGLSFANNPAFKSYVVLKSPPERVARNVSIVFGMYPVGLVVAPLAGGYLAQHEGMRLVFGLSTVLFTLSGLAATFIRDTPYHSAEREWNLGTLRANRTFRRYLWFFLASFLAVYVGQPFLNPYLAQVHGQGYAALGVFSSCAALGAVLLTMIGGRVTDLRGARAGTAVMLFALLAGTILLLTGWAPPVWALAMFLCGAYDSLRFVAIGIVNESFTDLPLAWGYAIFDTMMGLPMIGGAFLGGVLYRVSDGLPFAVVIAIAAALAAALLLAPRSAALRPVRPESES
jgi:MFS family permease